MDTNLNEDEYLELEEIYKAFGSTPRLKILNRLACGECVARDLEIATGLSQSATSHQLKELKEKRIVKSRKSGLNIFYALHDKHIIKIIESGIEHVKRECCHADDKRCDCCGACGARGK